MVSPAKSLDFALVVANEPQSLYGRLAELWVRLVRTMGMGNRVVVFTDETTAEAYRSHYGGKLRELCDDLVAIPEAKYQRRDHCSRHIKTSLGQYLEHPTLYVDIDAVPTGREVESATFPECDVACSLDHTPGQVEGQPPPFARCCAEEEGWKLDNDCYLNTGVIYFAGTDGSRAFAERWHSDWRERLAIRGEHRDQLAFNRVVSEAGRVRVDILPRRYNVLMNAAAEYARDAVFLHYTIHRGTLPPHSLLAHLAESYKLTGMIDLRAVRAARKLRTGWIGGVRWHLRMGEYGKALKRILSR